MKPEMKSKPAFTVVGMKYRGKNENNEISQLWEAFGPRMSEITNVVGQAYGVIDNHDETGEFDYIAGIKVGSAAAIPEGMVSFTVPEHLYAVFTCTLPTLFETFQRIYKEWLPQSGFKRDDGPEFELYDENFDPRNEDSKMYIYIPVSKV